MDNTYELNNNNFKDYKIILIEDDIMQGENVLPSFIEITIYLKNGKKLEYSINSTKSIAEEIQSLFDKIKNNKDYKLTITENLKIDYKDSFIEIKDSNNNDYKYNAIAK